MTYPWYPPIAVPPPVARPDRPAVVTVAGYLQLALTVLLLSSTALLVAEAVHFNGLIDRAAGLTDAAAEDVSAERFANVASTVVSGVILVLLAGLHASMFVPVRRGLNVARIVTLVAAGLPMLCGLCTGGMGTLAMLAEPGAGYPDGESAESADFYDTLYGLDSEMSWMSIAALTIMGLTAILGITIFVLLLLPPATRFFVPRAAPSVYLAVPGQPYGQLPPGAYPLYVYQVPPGAWPAGHAAWGPSVGDLPSPTLTDPPQSMSTDPTPAPGAPAAGDFPSHGGSAPV